ncbi:MAG: efflux transporter outer membrane subunit [Candidatus Gastranaerophilales bacterium]|nr:efflux transporter outer membrane subunit [Candidatus Gastranaerophilales bacterium]
MNKQKNLIFYITICLLMSANAAFSENTDNNIKPASQLKGTLVDNKAEYINSDWWGKFNDPILKDHILKAANTNQDIKIAALKVLETQEIVRESLGKEFPLLGFGTNFARNKTSGNVSMGSMSFPAYTQNSYRLPLDANYELDLWKKNRDKTLSLAKGLEAVKYDEKASYISLTSAVASTYFNILNIDKQIQLQKEIINLRKDIYDLTKENYNYGLNPAIDVVLTDKSLTEAQSGLYDLEKQQSIFLNQLAVLTGDSSDSSSALKRSNIDNMNLIKDLPLNIKSEIVKNRPDILKSEAEIQKTRIDVKLARKELFPDITLSGSFGFNANSLSKVPLWDSYITSMGGNLLQVVFSGGQRKARLKIKKYQYEQMLENYQKTVLKSFQEVNDSLAALKFDTQKNDSNIARIKSEGENLDNIILKYDKGAISYLDTLQYRERIITLEKEQIQSKTDCLIDSISLYKAVGGKL